ncbi:Phage tail fiber protein [Salmonella enterica subsp. enterica]|nr:Phage tail fiber protein [Salmonella enterica subsp. enterica]
MYRSKYDNPGNQKPSTAANIDRLRFTFACSPLVEANSKGDRNPTSVRLQIHLERYGQWVVEKEITITGKTTTQYLGLGDSG